MNKYRISEETNGFRGTVKVLLVLRTNYQKCERFEKQYLLNPKLLFETDTGLWMVVVVAFIPAFVVVNVSGVLNDSHFFCTLEALQKTLS